MKKKGKLESQPEYLVVCMCGLVLVVNCYSYLHFHLFPFLFRRIFFHENLTFERRREIDVVLTQLFWLVLYIDCVFIFHLFVILSTLLAWEQTTYTKLSLCFLSSCYFFHSFSYHLFHFYIPLSITLSHCTPDFCFFPVDFLLKTPPATSLILF